MNAQEDVRTDYFAFGGGLNQIGPPLSVTSGELLDALNYEPDVSAGYRRIAGYERFDGRTRPSDAMPVGVAATVTGTIVSGDSLTIGAATALFVRLIPGGLLVTRVVGTIPPLTAIMVGATQVGTTAAVVNQPYASSPKEEAQALYDCGEILRNLILAVPGSGPVRGAWMLFGVVYAARDNVGATRADIYKATATGWSLVPYFSELSFTAGQATQFAEGQTVRGNTSMATATVKRIVRETGSFASGSATGRLIVAPISGTFSAGESLRSSVDAFVANRATAVGAAVAIAPAPGGTWQTVNFNFSGQTATRRTYGVTTTSRGFEFDGTVFVPIKTGAADDRPQYVAAHKNYLFFALASSLMNSAVALPYDWQAAAGASEIAVGDDITGLKPLKGEALGVFTKNTIQQLLGSAPASFQLQSISPESGAVPRTVQTIGQTFALDDRGVTQVETTQAYGNFEAATVSRKVQPLIDFIRGKVIGSYLIRQRNQYRLMLGDGTVVIMFVASSERRDFMRIQYPFMPQCIYSDEDTTSGTERVFAGAADGFVYELERGLSFDGAAIEAYLRLWYQSNKSPRIRKRFRKVVVEMQSTLHSEVAGQAFFSYGDPDVGQVTPESNTVVGRGGLWNVADWDTFFYDSEQITQPSFRIDGTGTNVSLLFYSISAIDAGHLLQGAMVHYSPRRLQR